MAKSRRTAAGAANTDGGRRAGELGGVAGSTSESITAADRPQGKVSRLLLYGRENAVPLQQIVKLSGLDNRTARRMIEIERRAGIPICSDNQSGYYLAADAAELGRFVRSMQHRAGEIVKTARALDDVLQQATGQTRMEGF